MSTNALLVQIMYSFFCPTFPESKEAAWEIHSMRHICFQDFSRNLVLTSQNYKLACVSFDLIVVLNRITSMTA